MRRNSYNAKAQPDEKRAKSFDLADTETGAAVRFTIAPLVCEDGATPYKDDAPKFKPLTPGIKCQDTRKSLFNSWQKTTPLDWLMSATDKVGTHNNLSAPSFDKRTNTTAAADGFSLHIVRAKVADLPKRLDPKDKTAFPDYTKIVPPFADEAMHVTLTTRDMLEALQFVGVMAEYSMGTCVLEFTPERLTISAACAEFGETRAVIEHGQETHERKGAAHTSAYTCNGQASTAVNCKRLIESLKGMGDLVEFQIEGARTPLYLISDVDGQTREAVVMPMFMPGDETPCMYKPWDFVPMREQIRADNRKWAAEQYAAFAKKIRDAGKPKRQPKYQAVYAMAA